jgi:hypothetical protein
MATAKITIRVDSTRSGLTFDWSTSGLNYSQQVAGVRGSLPRQPQIANSTPEMFWGAVLEVVAQAVDPALPGT